MIGLRQNACRLVAVRLWQFINCLVGAALLTLSGQMTRISIGLESFTVATLMKQRSCLIRYVVQANNFRFLLADKDLWLLFQSSILIFNGSQRYASTTSLV